MNRLFPPGVAVLCAVSLLFTQAQQPAPETLPEPPYTYRATVTEVYDGDTITADVDLGFDVHYQARLRVLGIDAPEMTGPEKPRGIVTRDEVRRLILNREVVIASRKREKYGRWLADVTFILDGRRTDLAAHLIAQGLAEPYLP